MNKQTKRIRRNTKNITRNHYGGSEWFGRRDKNKTEKVMDEKAKQPWLGRWRNNKTAKVVDEKAKQPWFGSWGKNKTAKVMDEKAKQPWFGRWGNNKTAKVMDEKAKQPWFGRWRNNKTAKVMDEQEKQQDTMKEVNEAPLPVSEQDSVSGSTSELNDKNESIFNVIGNGLSDYSGKAIRYGTDKGLRLAGLRAKQPVETYNSTQQNVDNIFEKGSAAVIGNINNVLDSPRVNNSLNETAKKTAEIGVKILKNFNENLSTPEMKKQTKLALENAAEYAEIALVAMDEPINKALDKLHEAGIKAAASSISGAIKVGTDAMAAVPGVGAIVELGKVVNDVSTAVGNVVGAASDATNTMSKLVKETSNNINESVVKKRDSIANSINSFKPSMIFKKSNKDVPPPGTVSPEGSEEEYNPDRNAITASDLSEEERNAITSGDVSEEDRNAITASDLSEEEKNAIKSGDFSTPLGTKSDAGLLKRFQKGLPSLPSWSSKKPSINAEWPKQIKKVGGTVSNKNFKQLKKVGGTVSNRVEKSINQFENPINSIPVLSVGHKTRRKLFKNKDKSRRVRFTI